LGRKGCPLKRVHWLTLWISSPFASGNGVAEVKLGWAWYFYGFYLLLSGFSVTVPHGSLVLFVWFHCVPPSIILTLVEDLQFPLTSNHLQSFVDFFCSEASVSTCCRHSFAFLRFFFVFSMPHSLLRSFRSTRLPACGLLNS
jgi:hypothetical protein